MTLEQISRYVKLIARLESAEELLKSLQKAVRPGSQVINGMPKAPTVKDKIGKLITEIDDLKARIEYLKREIKREGRKINEFIERIHSESLRVAFRMKYLRGLTWAQIAEILGESYTEESVRMAAYRYLSDTKTID